jgi:hypothetical protein
MNGNEPQNIGKWRSPALKAGRLPPHPACSPKKQGVNRVNQWFIDHLWITYAIIFILAAFVYNKVFRVKKMSLFKEVIVYLIMAIGSFVLLFFQIDAGLPIIPSLGLAVLLMLIVRVRQWTEKGSDKEKKPGSSSGRE